MTSTVGAWYLPSAGVGGFLLDGQLFTNPPFNVTTMSTQHPITPSPELVLALRDSAPHALRRTAATRETWLITHAYQAGADIQLDVVLAKLKQLNLHSCYADALRDLCRSKPPSLKEQGLEAFMRSLEQTILAALSLRHTPSSTHIYGLYDPEGSVFTFYKSAAERDEAAEETIQNYLSDGEWCDDVTSICSFMVTHRATQIDVVSPVGKIDEDGCDEVGEYWPGTDCDCKCNYALKPFPTPEAPNV
jgi:hypothetical protein